MTQPGQERREFLDAEVRDYLHRLADEPDALLARLEGYAGERGFPKVGYLSGRWLEQFARSVNARRVYEFGSGFGYSAYFFAKAVGGEGEVWGSEVDAHELEAFSQAAGTRLLCWMPMARPDGPLAPSAAVCSIKSSKTHSAAVRSAEVAVGASMFVKTGRRRASKMGRNAEWYTCTLMRSLCKF